MSSVAAIVNPLDTKEALLFYCSDNSNLALEHRILGSEQYDKYHDNGSSDVAGPICTPGQFAAVRHNDVVTVYGITNVTVNKQTNTYVSLLSPIINPIADCTTSDAVTTHSALAAISDTVNDYVYFLQDNKDTSQSIIEYTFDADPSGSGQPIAYAHPRAGTQLAACYNSTAATRFVFYQNVAKTTDIWFARTDTENENRITESNILDGSAIAALEVLNATTNKMMLYIYYINGDGELTRFDFDEASNTWSGPWMVVGAADSERVKSRGLVGAINPPTGSGITAVANPNANEVEVFVQQGGKFVGVRDNLSRHSPTLRSRKHDE